MDIRKLAADETAILHLRGANEELLFEGEGVAKPVSVTLYGPGSRAYSKATQVRNNLLLEHLKRKGKSDMTSDESIEIQADFLAACTHSAQHIEYDKLTGTDMIKAVYADPSLGFIPEQVAKHLGEWRNFTKGSAKS